MNKVDYKKSSLYKNIHIIRTDSAFLLKNIFRYRHPVAINVNPACPHLAFWLTTKLKCAIIQWKNNDTKDYSEQSKFLNSEPYYASKKIVNQLSDFPVRRTGSYRHRKAPRTDIRLRVCISPVSGLLAQCVASAVVRHLSSRAAGLAGLRRDGRPFANSQRNRCDLVLYFSNIAKARSRHIELNRTELQFVTALRTAALAS